MHDEITADYNDMIYATMPEEIAARRKAMADQASCRYRKPGGSGRPFVHIRAPATEPMAQSSHHHAIERLHESSSSGSKPKPFCRRQTPLR
jgi:putative transposase